MKNIIGVIIILLLFSCIENTIKKDKSISDKLVKKDLLLKFRNYKDSVYIKDVYENRRALLTSIPSNRIIFHSNIVGNLLSMRDTINNELIKVFREENIISNNSRKTSMSNVFINKKFKSYLIYELREIDDKRLIIVNYKDNKLISWVDVSNNNSFDDGVMYSFVKDNDLWRIQYEDYGPNDVIVSDSIRKNMKRVFYKDFKIDEGGYVIPIE